MCSWMGQGHAYSEKVRFSWINLSISQSYYLDGSKLDERNVGQLASVILRRGVELRYKNYSQLKFNSLFELTMHP